ncbi:uncharacterized protein LOC107044636 [Diachasma alloeum]|uniref:uncharacterized protein LOC107044636 n=1 Tax=Diachasma alloeum TaxID=454923 RepID=UPI0007382942|nr:uncharacterized protein LOC107044636 [Diachasma alloeum]
MAPKNDPQTTEKSMKTGKSELETHPESVSDSTKGRLDGIWPGRGDDASGSSVVRNLGLDPMGNNEQRSDDGNLSEEETKSELEKRRVAPNSKEGKLPLPKEPFTLGKERFYTSAGTPNEKSEETANQTALKVLLEQTKAFEEQIKAAETQDQVAPLRKGGRPAGSKNSGRSSRNASGTTTPTGDIPGVTVTEATPTEADLLARLLKRGFLRNNSAREPERKPHGNPSHRGSCHSRRRGTPRPKGVIDHRSSSDESNDAVKTLRIRETDLLGVLKGCLTGSALTWYRQVEVYSWEDAYHAFRENFGELDYQVALHEEIASRRQGEDEPVAQFVANLKSLFARTDPEWPEQQKLTYMYYNTLSKYRIGFNLIANVTLKALEKHAMRQETLYASAEKWQPPRQPEESLCPSFAYRSTEAQRTTQRTALKALTPAEEPESTGRDHEESIFFEELEVEHALQGRGAPSGSGGGTGYVRPGARRANPQGIKCFNCDQRGHSWRICTGQQERALPTVPEEQPGKRRAGSVNDTPTSTPPQNSEIAVVREITIPEIKESIPEARTETISAESDGPDVERTEGGEERSPDTVTQESEDGSRSDTLTLESMMDPLKLVSPEMDFNLEFVRRAMKEDFFDQSWFFRDKSEEYFKFAAVERACHITVCNCLKTPGEEQHSQLQQLLNEKIPMIEGSLPISKLAPHKSDVEGHEPIRQRVRLASHHLKLTMLKEVDDMLKDGIIKPSASDWNSPVVMVKKPSGKYRFCIDFRRVNGVTKKNRYPVANMTDILDELRQANYISTLDLSAAYWQIPLAEDT